MVMVIAGIPVPQGQAGARLNVRGGMIFIIAAGVEHVPDEVEFGPVENALLTLWPPRAGCAKGSVFDDEEYKQIYEKITELGCNVWHMPKPLMDSLHRLMPDLTPSGAGTAPYRLPGLRKLK